MIDLILIALTLGVIVWGYWRGFSAEGLILLGFAGGALVGSRVAPLILEDGLRDSFAPVLALPGAVLFGAVAATVLERLVLGARHTFVRRPLFDGLAGGLVAGCLVLVVIWIAAAAATKVDGLSDAVADSEVVDSLNGVIPPPGPVVTPKDEPRDRLPIIAGPPVRVGAPTLGIKRDADVRSAARSVAKITASGCGHTHSGSGWIAGSGILATNAHVVRRSETVRVQMEGRGPRHDAEVIWYDDENDIALLRTPGVGGKPALPLDVDARPGTPSAVLGFPGGGPYTVTPARLGRTARLSGRRVEKQFIKRRVTSLRGPVRQGNSGGPVVDAEGRAVTMVFAGSEGGHGSYGVPLALVRSALRRAGPPVDSGDCS